MEVWWVGNVFKWLVGGGEGSGWGGVLPCPVQLCSGSVCRSSCSGRWEKMSSARAGGQVTSAVGRSRERLRLSFSYTPIKRASVSFTHWLGLKWVTKTSPSSSSSPPSSSAAPRALRLAWNGMIWDYTCRRRSEEFLRLPLVRWLKLFLCFINAASWLLFQGEICIRTFFLLFFCTFLQYSLL